MIDRSPLCPPDAPCARARSRPKRQIDVLYHHEHLLERDPVETLQHRRGLAASIHVRHRLRDDQAIGRCRSPCDQRIRRRRRERQASSSRQLIGHDKADIVTRISISRPRVPDADDSASRLLRPSWPPRLMQYRSTRCQPRLSGRGHRHCPIRSLKDQSRRPATAVTFPRLLAFLLYPS